MISQPARVLNITKSSYVLQTLPKSACPRCDAGQGCGAGLLAKAFSNKTYQLSISKNSLKKNTYLKINQLVQIGIPSELLVRASLIVYLLPLIFMVSTALIIGSLTMNQDVYTVTAAIIGFVIGLLIAKRLSNHYFKTGISSPVLIEQEEENCWYQSK